jgi:MATE family multidrug resistance protein
MSELQQALSEEWNIHFRSFCEKSLCSENLEFYEAVEIYHKIENPTDRPGAAQSLYRIFIEQGSDKEINIEYTTRRYIESNLLEAPISLFEKALQEIVHLLNMDILPRFKERFPSFPDSPPQANTFKKASSSRPHSQETEADSVTIALEPEMHVEDRPLPLNRANWLRKTKELAPIAASVSLSNIIQVMNSLILLIFVGRHGGPASAAAGLANFYIAVTGISFCFGVLGAQDTLGAQAFGAKNMHRVSIVFQRAMGIMMAMAVPISILWFATEPLLVALGQDREVSKFAAKFVLIYLPSLPALLLEECLKRYLYAQGIASPALFSTLASNVLSVGLGYFLILHTPVTFYGMPIALGVSNVLTLVFMAGWTIHQRLYVDTWRRIRFLELLCWHDNIEFLRLGVPGALMMCAEWIGIELHALMAGWISVPALAAQAIIFNSNYAFFSIALGGAISTCVSVGNEMGSGRFREGVLAYLIGLFDFELLAAFIAVLLFLLRHVWGSIFTNVTEVQHIIASIVPLWSLFIFSDAGGAVGGGAIRGVGEQTKAAICNLVTFYGVGIPLGYWLAFPMKWGLPGLWVGLVTASYIVGALVNGILIFGDWEKWAIAAKKRSEVPTLEPLPDSENGTTADTSRNSVELSEVAL